MPSLKIGCNILSLLVLSIYCRDRPYKKRFATQRCANAHHKSDLLRNAARTPIIKAICYATLRERPYKTRFATQRCANAHTKKRSPTPIENLTQIAGK
jgi:hypothetical protein